MGLSYLGISEPNHPLTTPSNRLIPFFHCLDVDLIAGLAMFFAADGGLLGGDAVVAGTFLAMVVAIVLICLYEWARLVRGARAPDLKESEPVWLPDYAVIEGGRPLNTAGAVALACAMAKEISGEAELDRIAAQQAAICCEEHRQSRDQIYVQTMEERYKSIRRCC